MNGLRHEIHVEVRLLQSANLEAVTVLAQQVEERNLTLQGLKKGRVMGRAWKAENLGYASFSAALLKAQHHPRAVSDRK